MQRDYDRIAAEAGHLHDECLAAPMQSRGGGTSCTRVECQRLHDIRDGVSQLAAERVGMCRTRVFAFQREERARMVRQKEALAAEDARRARRELLEAQRGADEAAARSALQRAQEAERLAADAAKVRQINDDARLYFPTATAPGGTSTNGRDWRDPNMTAAPAADWRDGGASNNARQSEDWRLREIDRREVRIREERLQREADVEKAIAISENLTSSREEVLQDQAVEATLEGLELMGVRTSRSIQREAEAEADRRALESDRARAVREQDLEDEQSRQDASTRPSFEPPEEKVRSRQALRELMQWVMNYLAKNSAR